jgi:hypothetical protein
MRLPMILSLLISLVTNRDFVGQKRGFKQIVKNVSFERKKKK